MSHQHKADSDPEFLLSGESVFGTEDEDDCQLPEEGQLSDEDDAALLWLMSHKPQRRSHEEMMRWLFFLGRAAGANQTPSVDDLANATVKLRRSETDEWLRRWLPVFLMAVGIMMIVLVWLDSAGHIQLKPGTITAINGSIFTSVVGLLGCVVTFLFGRRDGPRVGGG